jgi:signal transduction histidine kinase
MAAKVTSGMTPPQAPGATPAEPPAPSLAALRLARVQRDIRLRRLRPAALIILALLVVVAIRKHPGPGLHGDSIGILIALAAMVAGGTGALALPRTVGRVLAVPFIVLVAGSVALVWLQPDGPGDLGAVVAAIAAIWVLPGRRSRVVAAACVAVVSLALVLAATTVHPNGRLLDGASLLGALLPGVICAAVLLTRRLDRYSYQIERLLLELEQAQNAEVRAAALAERQRLAREMHDVLAHSLSGLTLQLEGARLLAAENPADPRLAETIERAHHLAKSGLLEARRAIGMLRDEQLPGPERLAALVAEFEHDTGLRCEFSVEGEQRPLSPEARLTVYRVAQEALTNVRKHADAGRAEVRLCYRPDATRLTVADFGKDAAPVARVPAIVGSPVAPASAPAGPVAPASALAGPVALAGPGSRGRGNGSGAHRAGDSRSGGGYGLAGMRERAELIGGTLSARKTQNGFLVELWVPA